MMDMYEPPLKSIALRYDPNSMTPTDVSLNWSEVSKQITVTAGEGGGLTMLSFTPEQVRKSLIADGSNTLILDIEGTRHVFGVVSPLSNMRRGYFIAMIANSVVARGDTNIYAFQSFLKHEGVKVSRSSMVKIILYTFIGFIIALALLITWAVNFYV